MSSDNEEEDDDDDDDDEKKKKKKKKVSMKTNRTLQSPDAEGKVGARRNLERANCSVLGNLSPSLNNMRLE